MTYFCTVCAARWSYAQIRYLGRCRACGAPLTSTPPEPPARAVLEDVVCDRPTL